MPEFYIENVTLKTKTENEVKAIRTAINEFVGFVDSFEKNDNFIYIDLNVININIYCIEKEFYKLLGVPKDEFKKIRIKINLIENYIDENVLEKDKKISISIATIKEKEIIEDTLNILKKKIFIIKLLD